MMTIYSALRKDHRKVESLLGQLVEASENGGDWQKIVDLLRDELIPHSRVEEALFYNAIRDSEAGRKLVFHSFQEHAMIETDLRALQLMKAIDANWTVLAKRLRADFRKHVEEEESKVFAAARILFSDEESRAIGQAFEAMKERVREQSIAGTSADLVINLLPRSVRERLAGSAPGNKGKDEVAVEPVRENRHERRMHERRTKKAA